MDKALRYLIRNLTIRWGSRPHCVLACQDAADEHWQVFYPFEMNNEEPMPMFTIDTDGVIHEHG